MRPIATLTLAALLTAGGLGTQAEAQFGKGTFIFMMLNKNGDNVIDRSEIEAHRERMFTEMDTNADGVITVQEMEAARTAARNRRARQQTGGASPEERRAQAWASLDGDGDGLVSRDEFVAQEPAMLTLGDTNGDGQLTRQELGDLVKRGEMAAPFMQQ